MSILATRHKRRDPVKPQELILSGFGLTALGGIITGATYGSAGGGDTHMVILGLMAVGDWNFLRGLYRWTRQQSRH
jgi:hypothetical protein